jgi:hypothetical protein
MVTIRFDLAAKLYTALKKKYPELLRDRIGGCRKKRLENGTFF